MIAGNATPSEARIMWNPSVNAIWLRDAARSVANGMAVSSIAPRRSPSGFDRRRLPLHAREPPLDHLVSGVARECRNPVGEHLEALSFAAEVIEVHAQVGRKRRPA